MLRDIIQKTVAGRKECDNRWGWVISISFRVLFSDRGL